MFGIGEPRDCETADLDKYEVLFKKMSLWVRMCPIRRRLSTLRPLAKNLWIL